MPLELTTSSPVESVRVAILVKLAALVSAIVPALGTGAAIAILAVPVQVSVKDPECPPFGPEVLISILLGIIVIRPTAPVAIEQVLGTVPVKVVVTVDETAKEDPLIANKPATNAVFKKVCVFIMFALKNIGFYS